MGDAAAILGLERKRDRYGKVKRVRDGPAGPAGTRRGGGAGNATTREFWGLLDHVGRLVQDTGLKEELRRAFDSPGAGDGPQGLKLALCAGAADSRPPAAWRRASLRTQARPKDDLRCAKVWQTQSAPPVAAAGAPPAKAKAWGVSVTADDVRALPADVRAGEAPWDEDATLHLVSLAARAGQAPVWPVVRDRMLSYFAGRGGDGCGLPTHAVVARYSAVARAVVAARLPAVAAARAAAGQPPLAEGDADADALVAACEGARPGGASAEAWRQREAEASDAWQTLVSLRPEDEKRLRQRLGRVDECLKSLRNQGADRAWYDANGQQRLLVSSVGLGKAEVQRLQNKQSKTYMHRIIYLNDGKPINDSVQSLLLWMGTARTHAAIVAVRRAMKRHQTMLAEAEREQKSANVVEKESALLLRKLAEVSPAAAAAFEAEEAAVRATLRCEEEAAETEEEESQA